MKKILLIYLCALMFFACSNDSKENKDKIALLSSEDENIRIFKDSAQKQIDYLISFMNEHDKSDTLFQYFVKSNFREGQENEHMWSYIKEFKDNYFIGTLSNDPAMLKKIKDGDSVKILKTDVEDWILNDYLTNTKVGGFSQKYLRTKGQ